MARADPVKAGP